MSPSVPIRQSLGEAVWIIDQHPRRARASHWAGRTVEACNMYIPASAVLRGVVLAAIVASAKRRAVASGIVLAMAGVKHAPALAVKSLVAAAKSGGKGLMLFASHLIHHR